MATPPQPPAWRGRRTDYGTTGRPGAAEADTDSAGVVVPFEGLRAGRIRRRTMLEYTAASGSLEHATFLERAVASVRCSGFEAKLLRADRTTRHGPGRANDL
jgi:hypothetical protein